MVFIIHRLLSSTDAAEGLGLWTFDMSLTAARLHAARRLFSILLASTGHVANGFMRDARSNIYNNELFFKFCAQVNSSEFEPLLTYIGLFV